MSDIDGKSASHTSPDQGPQVDPNVSQMRVTDQVFTLFVSAVSKKPHRGGDCTLGELHKDIQNGKWWDKVAPVRDLAPYKDEKDSTGKLKSTLALEYSKLKDSTLPYAVVSGTWDLEHRHADGAKHGGVPCKINGIKVPSGIRLLDLDGLSERQQTAIKAKLDAGIVPWIVGLLELPGRRWFARFSPPSTHRRRANRRKSSRHFAALIADLGNKLPTRQHTPQTRLAKTLMRPSFVSADSDARIYPDVRSPTLAGGFGELRSRPTNTAHARHVRRPAETARQKNRQQARQKGQAEPQRRPA